MLLDSRGCLTEAGLRTLAAAPPGAAPSELASHVALCARCQDRMLAAARGPTAARQPSTSRLWLGILVAVAGLLLALMALFVARVLSTAPP